MQHQGSCLCGAVKYAVTGSFNAFYLCHCARCKKGTGTAHGANLFAFNAQIDWLQGQAQVKRYQHLNTRHVKSFCTYCGSPLPTLDPELNGVVVPAGSLDTDVPMSPSAQIFVKSRAAWFNDIAHIPCFNGLPK
ncbi:GFA family protein [Pseudoalteromonas sp. MMG024]|uniref:GFA family protein n=1 Tax=Pseudoalteromonas sp. MMG024 TaxID=2909980 RepID=UPI001F38C231|nr:GFA family protein [Pseudoalteromonas sp. MMG024]MCF6457248.1 GFA family protein [Pseudoalteromonas sp. MMG024]